MEPYKITMDTNIIIFFLFMYIITIITQNLLCIKKKKKKEQDATHNMATTLTSHPDAHAATPPLRPCCGSAASLWQPAGN